MVEREIRRGKVMNALKKTAEGRVEKHQVLMVL